MIKAPDEAVVQFLEDESIKENSLSENVQSGSESDFGESISQSLLKNQTNSLYKEFVDNRNDIFKNVKKYIWLFIKKISCLFKTSNYCFMKKVKGN